MTVQVQSETAATARKQMEDFEHREVEEVMLKELQQLVCQKPRSRAAREIEGIHRETVPHDRKV
jgi:hypothetical protein